jgi:hypothetical protein
MDIGILDIMDFLFSDTCIIFVPLPFLFSTPFTLHDDALAVCKGTSHS